MKNNGLRRCPFCGSEAEMHTPDSNVLYANSKNEIPKGAQILRETKYPSGHICIEYKVKEFVPRCSDTSCSGRTVKRYKTELLARTAWNMRNGRAMEGERE